ncbi:Proteasome subunit beta type [Zostera marina]|uniref:Proteasome subunit beta type n=1 Tax=Zostera marina TaxID=29655 RepID=A0A0K9PAS3_ZOSMR|nr:Proteasome subunit beta type [Zostera marina]
MMRIDTSGLDPFAPFTSASGDVYGDVLSVPSFELPRTTDFDGFQKKSVQMVKPAKGTTTLAFIFKDGVIVAADSRASMGGYICMSIVYLFFLHRTMIAGWDETGPGLYYVDSEGGRLKGKRFSVGSGSPYAYGVLDDGYRYNMSVEEAGELGRRAIYHATFRDAASGGVASVYHVGPNGWQKLSGDDVGDLHYKYYPVIAAPVEQEMSEAPSA